MKKEKHKTYIGNTIYEVGEKARYDGQVKKLLSDKTILARIIKETVEEFKKYSVEQIRECIEGEPQVAAVKVRPGYAPEAIIGNSTEDAVIGEGKVTYDILFYVITPTKEKVKLIINVEAQKKYHPGYDLVTRAVFYCARNLSSQLDKEFTTDDYDGIKKVYSIWICMDVPAYAKNTITKYSMSQEKLYGNFSGKARYDLLTVIMIGLGKNEEEENPLIGMLDVLLSEELTPKEKEEYVEEKYGVEVSVEVKEALNTMCNLSDLIEEKGIEKGIEKGRVEGIIHMAGTLLKHNLSEEYIISVLQDELKLTKEEAREFFAEKVACLRK